MKEYLNSLLKSDIFSDKDIELINNREDLKPALNYYNKNSIIHLAGEKCNALEIIVKGEALVQSIDEDGNALTINDLTVGEAMSANLLFSSQPFYPMSVFAKTDIVIISFSKRQILTFCQQQSFLESFLRCLADRTATLSGKIRVLKQKSLREQILGYLVAQYKVQNTKKIRLKTTKKALANRFGVRRSSLSRELSKMRDDGIIEFDAKSITILDDTFIKL